ncbi:hypothetical protein FOH38_01615 [Lysinibacillus fusiformis]|nr:hypothetical protein FOH38_01615 [Lysinibacillus fusiformis]
MSSIAQEQIATIAEVAIAKFNELQQEEKVKRLDRRLFNTRILLKNYRHLKVYCNEMKENMDLEDGEQEEIIIRNT